MKKIIEYIQEWIFNRKAKKSPMFADANKLGKK